MTADDRPLDVRLAEYRERMMTSVHKAEQAEVMATLMVAAAAAGNGATDKAMFRTFLTAEKLGLAAEVGRSIVKDLDLLLAGEVVQRVDAAPGA